MSLLRRTHSILRRTPIHRMAGLSLVEISLSLALVGVSTAWLARNLLRDSQQLLATSEAQNLVAIQKSLQSYLDEYAMQLIQTPEADIQRTVAGSTGAEVVTLPAGSVTSNSFWPTLEQLKRLQLMPQELNLVSRVSVGRDFVSGPIQIYTLGDDETPQPDTSQCLTDGCVLRIIAYPQPDSSGAADAPAQPASLTHQLLRTVGASGLLANTADGRYYNLLGQMKGFSPAGQTRPGDVGVYAEVRIPSLAQRKLTSGLACEPGFFGFSTGSRNPSDAAEFGSSTPTRCVAPHGHIPVGQQAIAYDLRSPMTGHVRLVCEWSAAAGALAIVAAQDAAEPLGPTDSLCNP